MRMLLFCQTHLDPKWTIPFACFAAAILIAYWVRLERSRTPRSRKWIRRSSIIIMLACLPLLVRASSFLDPEVDQRAYVITWTIATFAVLAVLATALIDIVNSMRMHVRSHDAAIHEALQRYADSRNSENGDGVNETLRPEDEPA